jgi:hypothetical protein
MTTSLLREHYPDLAEELREAAVLEAGGPVDLRERLDLNEAEAVSETWDYGGVVQAGLEALGADLAGPRAKELFAWAARTDEQEEGR